MCSEHIPPVAEGLCASALQLSSPVMTPTASSSVGSGWLRPGYVPETSAFARRGPALLSSFDGFRFLLHHLRCSYRLPALHECEMAGKAASAVQLVITAEQKQQLFQVTVLECTKNPAIVKYKALYLRRSRQWRYRR